MSLLDKLERTLRPYALPHVTIGLIVGQVYVLFMGYVRPDFVGALPLAAEKVLAGEWWRLFTFVFLPPAGHPLLAIFSWYLFYLMGTALELYWGTFRYNVFLLVGWVATVAAAFITPEYPATDAFLMGSVFLAFAFLNPEFELSLFFVLPVKIKWFALVTWCGYGVVLLFGPTWGIRLSMLASVCNFFLFFGKDVFLRMQGARRRMAMQAKQYATPPREYFHRCTVCGITDKTHPKMEFRYCSQCAGSLGYCMDHLRNHEHVTEAKPPA